MTTALYVVLAIVLTGPVFWCWGHSTARIRHVPIGATKDQDDAAIRAETARFHATLARLDFAPDNRKDAE